MTPESKVKNKVKRALTNLDAYFIMPATGGYGSSGAPDFVACIKGRFVGIECKAGKNEPTALQMRALHDIIDCGGVSMIVNEKNVDDVEAEIVLKLLFLMENEAHGKDQN